MFKLNADERNIDLWEELELAADTDLEFKSFLLAERFDTKTQIVSISQRPQIKVVLSVDARWNVCVKL